MCTVAWLFLCVFVHWPESMCVLEDQTMHSSGQSAGTQVEACHRENASPRPKRNEIIYSENEVETWAERECERETMVYAKGEGQGVD